MWLKGWHEAVYGLAFVNPAFTLVGTTIVNKPIKLIPYFICLFTFVSAESVVDYASFIIAHTHQLLTECDPV